MALFQKYAHNDEKAIDRFLKSVSESSSRQFVHDQLVTLLQSNTVVLNLWVEKRFKNYRYLNSTSKRKQLYTNAQLLADDFAQFLEQYQTPPGYSERVFQHYRLPFPEGMREQLHYMNAIMTYLKPGQRYHYIESATFGKLLANPQTSRLEGDCNQVVTLYVFLYAQRYPVTDLQIKLLKDHVCLHFQGVDIEATNGSYMHYTEYEYIAPVSELVSVNLLDVNDFRETTAKLAPKSLLQSAQLAYQLSSMRKLVDRNLRVAYHNLALSALKAKDYKRALGYAQKSGSGELVHYTQQQIVAQAVEAKNFSKASYYAKQTRDSKLQRYVEANHANYLYHNKKYAEARKKYQKLGETKMVKATYAGEYNVLQQQVAGIKTIDQMKKKKATYRKLLTLAKKAGLREAEAQLRKLLTQI